MSRKLDDSDSNETKKLKIDGEEEDEILEETEDILQSNEASYGIKQRVNTNFKIFNGIFKMRFFF